MTATQPMDELTARVIKDGVLELACALRDDGPDVVRTVAERLLALLPADHAAVLCVAAALINVDLPVDTWWERPATPRPLRRAIPLCGTRSGFDRHKRLGETVDDACREAERTYQRERRRVERTVARLRDAG